MASKYRLVYGVGIIVLGLGFAVAANAQWQKEEDAPAHFESIVTSMKVNSDYSTETTEEYTVVVDKQAGIDSFAIIKLPYTPSTEMMKVIFAEAIAGGKSFKIDPKQVEDKEVAQQAQGYDSAREVRFSLPQIAVGSKVHFKIWTKHLPHLLPRFVSENYELSGQFPVKSVQLELNSAVPIDYRVHDPKHQLRITETKSANGLRLQLSSTSSISQNIVGELSSAFSEPQAPVLYFSNQGSWTEFGNQIAKEYETVAQAPLPPEFSLIVDDAKAKSDPLDQIELALEHLHKTIHYVGSWKTVKGQYFPRSLSEIATTRFGDCKDYTIASVAILRKLGFDATPAWTNVETASASATSLEALLGLATSARVPTVVGFQPPLPGLFFNHAIVKLKLNDRELWLDPTSPISYARGVAPELIGKYALTLKDGGAKMETVPFGKPGEEVTSTTKFLLLNEDRTADEISRVRMKGYTAAVIASQEAEGKIQLTQLTQVLNEPEAIRQKKTSSFAAGELVFDKGKKGEELGSDTSAGAGVKFGYPILLMAFAMDQGQTVGNLFNPFPAKVTSTTYIQGGTLLGAFPAPCNVETPWFKASRTFTRENDATKVVEDTELKESWIENTVLQGKEFKEAKDKLRECWKESTLVFEPFSFKAATASVVPIKPWTLTPWQIKKLKAQKVASKSYKYAMGMIRKKDSAQSPFPLVQIAPEWSTGKSTAELKEKITALLDNYQGDSLLPLAAKFLVREALHATPDDADLFASMANGEDRMAMINSGEYDPKGEERARSYAYYGLWLDPLNQKANRALARLLTEEKGKSPPGSLKDAVAEAEFTLKLNPNWERAKVELAGILLKAKQPERALEVSKGVSNHDLIGDIYKNLKRFDEAETEYLQALNEHPTAWGYVNYASFLHWRNKPDQSIEMAKKALDIQEFGMAHHILSLDYSTQAKNLATASGIGAADKVLPLLNKALQEDNTNGEAHRYLGITYALMTDKDPSPQLFAKAFKELQTALQIDAKDEMASNYLQQLKERMARRSFASFSAKMPTPTPLPTQ